MNNYFKVADRFFFFVTSKITDTRRAYEQALLSAGSKIESIAVYELPDNAGPWDRVGIVGHRRRGEILGDISNETDANEVEYRKAELERLDRLYFAAGRDALPLAEVA